jgi:hypothetical protein
MRTDDKVSRVGSRDASKLVRVFSSATNKFITAKVSHLFRGRIVFNNVIQIYDDFAYEYEVLAHGGRLSSRKLTHWMNRKLSLPPLGECVELRCRRAYLPLAKTSALSATRAATVNVPVPHAGGDKGE